MKINLKWPMEEDNDLAPWYITTWRLPFVPFIYLGFCISFIAIFLGYGKDMALDWWDIKESF